ncbi:MAG: NAD-dependent deacetylase [Candidatus Krumholzibacteriia bacterium]
MMPPAGPNHQDLQAVRERIAAGARIAVLSGAGISAASGIPTFRGAQDSLWSRYRPEQLATPEAFRQDPELVWRWYDWRRGLIHRSEPNPAHAALARLQDTNGIVIVTQNVDGYHQAAGSRTVLEYHGSIWTVRCTGCGAEAKDFRVPLPIPPLCAECGGLLRPGVVWFGEGIDPGVMRESEQAAAGCDLFLVVGTAGAVYPAAGLANVAGRAGATVVEFNLEPGGITHLADLFVAGSAAHTLPLIVP